MSLVFTEKIGILGGVFDPIHNGHLAVAQMALEYFNLSKVIFIPSGIPPHKMSTVSTSVIHRLEMLDIAIKNNNSFHVCDEEINRGGISYTVDTLAFLRTQYPNTEFNFIIGSDNLREIVTWRKFREIVSDVTLCVVHRPGYSMDVPESLVNAKIEQCPSPEWGISSTMVRNLILNKLSCRYILPDGVIEYINRNNLYNCNEDSCNAK